ncbi:galactose oxidase [Parapedobacter sp. DT-150]|uniref:galactose oxidase n=1 Tax=Parapedobacter sp. DT-150 TaxID=3396162 RepID=UPI003F1CF938
MLIFSMAVAQACHDSERTDLAWRQLPQVPDEVGFAGAFAGISQGQLLVAGGANFPKGTRPWTGGTKYWNDGIYVLRKDADHWEEVGKLPRPMGYGVSITWKDRVLIFGGADQERHYEDAYMLHYADGQVNIDTLPSLPEPNANACGALIGDVVYIAGGLASPTAKAAKSTFWRLDMGVPPDERHWQALETWPGEPRMLSVAGAMDGAFYLFSGVSLAPDESGTSAERKYLTDGFRYMPNKGWEKISDLPHPVAAAPSPAYVHTTGQQLLVFGGDDGSKAGQNEALKDKHPGFNTAVLVYDNRRNAWRISGAMPTDQQPDPENNPNASTWAPVTTPLVEWDGEVILPMGEVRPGVRTNRVLVGKLLND